MFGWEYPPFLSGGLGVASEGLVRGLLEIGTEVVLVLPHHPFPSEHRNLKIVDSGALAIEGAPKGARSRRRRPNLIRRIPALLRPYTTESDYAIDLAAARRLRAPMRGLYGPDLTAEVLRYAEAAGRIARRERFDVIHAHDWLTFAAGLEARRVSGKPLVAHVHATEFDRSGGIGNRFVSDLERLGLESADRVVAVSRFTAGLVAERYGVPAERIRVVYNSIDAGGLAPDMGTGASAPDMGSGDQASDAGAAAGPAAVANEPGPLVLFAGRVTWQKGPRYFVEAAALVARELPAVRFAVAGSGDRLDPIRRRVDELGLTDRFLFTGFLPSNRLELLYAEADVYVMPSVSEPFGLTALEALRHGTPVILSRHAGVSEVVRHVLRVDFDDTRDIASKILSVLLHRPLSDALSRSGLSEVRRMSWKQSATICAGVYDELCRSAR